MKSILILGAGVMQGPAIKAAKAKGLRVVLADGNAGALHADSGDTFLHIDLKDKEALAVAAAGIPDLCGVFTAGTDFSASVAWVAGALGLPGIPYEAAMDASDKARMRARLSAAGVPVPAWAAGSVADDPYLLAGSIGTWPLVVKPVDNMGARGCRLARSAGEFAGAWEDALANSRTGRAIVEAYLDGPEFSLDAIVVDGQVTIRGIADRLVTFSPFFVEMGHTMPTAYGDHVVEAVSEVFRDGIAALGITRGAAKGDIKYTRDGAVVGEIANRLSGGYMSGWTYPYSSGIDVTSEAIDIACGLCPAPAGPAMRRVCAERAFISIPGIVAEVSGIGEAHCARSVKDVFVRVAAGDTVVFPSNNVQKCGNVIALADDRASAETSADEAARNIVVRLEPGNQATAAFLRGEGHLDGPDGAVWPPSAFCGLSAMTLASLSTMPAFLGKGEGLSIAPLRGIPDENGTDWQGRTIAGSLALIEKFSGVTVGMHGGTILGAVFWSALIRGGYQAGLWVVQTVAIKGTDYFA